MDCSSSAGPIGAHALSSVILAIDQRSRSIALCPI